MALTTHPVRTGVISNTHAPIVVEMSDRPLPLSMRVGSVRSSLRHRRPHLAIAPRILAVPVALALRILSRDSGRIDLTLR